MKKISALILALLLAFIFVLPIGAIAQTNTVWAEYDYSKFNKTQHFYDLSGNYVDATKHEALEKKLMEKGTAIGTQLIVIYLDDYVGKTQDLSDSIYAKTKFGYGDSESGILCLVNMKEREVSITTYGDGIKIMSDYHVELMLDNITKALSKKQYSKVVDSVISSVNVAHQSYLNNGEIPVGLKIKQILGSWLISLIAILPLSLLFAIITTKVKKKKHNTILKKHDARAYIKEEDMKYSTSENKHVRRYQTRTKIPPPSSSGGSHSSGSTHSHSSGRSFGGGSRKF